MCLHTWTAAVLRKWPELGSTLGECCGRDTSEDESPSALAEFPQELEVLSHKSVWTEGQGLCTNQEATNTSSQSRKMLAGFRSFDPPTEKKLACHPDLPLFAVTNAYKGKASVVRQATGELVSVCIAFYYPLRIGEYNTKTRRKKKTRTHQFRVKDVTSF